MGDFKGLREIEKKLNSFLKNGEKILWKGHPEKHFYLKPMDIYITAIGIFFLIFSTFSAIDSFRMHIRGGRDIVGGITDIPFILIGLYLTFGRLIRRYKKLKKTHYFITDKRVILAEKFFGDYLFNTIEINKIKGIDKKIKNNGLGDITFIGGGMSKSDMKGNFSSSERNSLTFINVKDIYDIINLVNKLKEETNG